METSTCLRIAIVDDNPADAQLLQQHAVAYARQSGQPLQTMLYPDGLDFLDHFSGNFDVVFMDVEMPHLNGIDVARRMREVDAHVALVFITNMAQYAIRGYEVNAIDYVIKPVNYYAFENKLRKAAANASYWAKKTIAVSNEHGFICLSLGELYYLDKDKNYILFHAAQKTYRERGSLKTWSEQLEPYGFCLCNSGCLVNLRFVTQLTRDDLTIAGEHLPISRAHRKTFSERFLAFLGQGGQ